MERRDEGVQLKKIPDLNLRKICLNVPQGLLLVAI